MKKVLLSVLLGVLGFTVTYIGLCYFVPGWRIKLDAEPLVYFLKSLKHMAFLKCVISSLIAVAAAVIPIYKK
ncbi:MAG: hypothetical protein IKA16_05355 [Oscillospiraceae bacterium]|nr:hypothetical protein [Oscillospiraceae bacterium]